MDFFLDFSSPRSIVQRSVIVTLKTDLGKHAEIPASSSYGETLLKSSSRILRLIYCLLESMTTGEKTLRRVFESCYYFHIVIISTRQHLKLRSLLTQVLKIKFKKIYYQSLDLDPTYHRECVHTIRTAGGPILNRRRGF